MSLLTSWMSREQPSQWIPRMETVVCIVIKEKELALREAYDFHEFCNEGFLFRLRAELPLGTRVQVTFEDVALDMLQVTLHGENELDDLRSVSVFLNHRLDLRGESFEPLDGILCFLPVVVTHREWWYR